MLFYFYAGRVEHIDGGRILNKGVCWISIVSLADQLRDFVIILLKLFLSSAFDVARDIKGKFPNIHCVVLTPFSHGITKRMQNEDLSIFEIGRASCRERV